MLSVPLCSVNAGDAPAYHKGSTFETKYVHQRGKNREKSGFLVFCKGAIWNTDHITEMAYVCFHLLSLPSCGMTASSVVCCCDGWIFRLIFKVYVVQHLIDSGTSEYALHCVLSLHAYKTTTVFVLHFMDIVCMRWWYLRKAAGATRYWTRATVAGILVVVYFMIEDVRQFLL